MSSNIGLFISFFLFDEKVRSFPFKPNFSLLSKTKTAADVLVYFGSLQNLLSTFSSISSPGSLLVFSCEKATETEAPLGWRLTTSGRFAHTKEHAISMAESVGYNLKHYQDIVPRIEKGDPVKGHLFGFQLSSPKEKGGE